MSTLPPPPSRSDSAALRLREEILSGTAEPGSLLAESAVAQRLGVSRVPVREALFALEREGLIEFSDTGRAYVKELSPHDFEELYRFLYDNASVYVPGNEGMVAIYTNEYTYQSNFRLDKEINCMALIARLIELK